MTTERKRLTDPQLDLPSDATEQAVEAQVQVQEFVTQITANWNKQVTSIIKVGQLLIRAKKELEHGAFMKMTETMLPFSHNTATRLMRIARNQVICAHVHIMPRSWGTLHALCAFPEEVLDMMISEGTINSDLERHEVEEMLTNYQGVDIEDKREWEDERNWKKHKRGNVKPRKPLSEDEKRVIRIANTLVALVECMFGSPDQHTVPPKYFTKRKLDITGLEKAAEWVARFAENAPSGESADRQAKYDESTRPKRKVTPAQEAALQRGRDKLFGPELPPSMR